MRARLAAFAAAPLLLLAQCAPACLPGPAGPQPPGPPPPAGVLFQADFSTPGDFYERFDHGWSGLDPATWPASAGAKTTWHGDHDTSCQGPTTQRDVHITPGQAGKEGVFWWCAPNGPDTGHVMTGVDTIGYNIVWFSPRGYFTGVRRVCWDLNLTETGGKWTQVVLAARTDVEREVAETGHLDLGFTGPEFQLSDGPTTQIHPTDATVGVKQFRGNFSFWIGDEFPGGQEFSDRVETQDKATRYQHCMTDNRDGTVTLTQDRPSGTTDVRTTPGAFPSGEVRVVFQDDNYDPEQDSGFDPDVLTWHWDNVLIES